MDNASYKKLFLYFIIFISTLTSHVSVLATQKNSSLALKGYVPHYFSLSYKVSDQYISFQKSANFNFFGNIKTLDRKIKFDRPYKLSSKNEVQVVTVEIN